jgi:putative transcriptional regulator
VTESAANQLRGESPIEPQDIKQIRSGLGLSQAKFAFLIQVEITTLQNWEQGRRLPTGQTKALLKAIKNDPKHVLTALAD